MELSSFSPLIEQEQAIELLERAVDCDRVAPAYLFAGPSGVGRRLAAQCFIERLFLSLRPGSPGTGKASTSLRTRLQQGNHPDLLWVEPTYLYQGNRFSAAEAAAAGIKRKTPPQIRLEQIREVVQFLGRPPLEATRSIVVLNEAETMAEPAANALLKTLEEPGQATFILIAPGPEALLPTLVSRCQRIPFRRLTATAMAEVLTQANQSEILAHPEVLTLAQGSPGAAIGHWQQLQAIPPDLLATLRQFPQSVRAALDLARQIDKALEVEAQLWLVDYLQQCYWQWLCQVRPTQINPLQELEKARRCLSGFAQPRLVWEVTLMGLIGTEGRS
ncbi:DNA polymerase III subunit delta' [Leptolyngbya sp. 'hensonii']|uniref:DNA polymerase III subunit delta' n=1 Tax=Leptolyngbya sp. 'hensonii' TaxID=1922337 RepID=UPI0009501903|nr:DNA polymerase III subunit delta' [Leptolyngbya sp. 'hensonii']OLP15959.1 DNA polymerase III subunit delta' [Leptolyngbya sp. 'hensonii']